MQHMNAEKRLLSLFKNLGEDMRDYGRDLNERYLSGPWKRGDNIQKVGGPIMAGASLLLEGPDRLWASMLDQKLEAPTGIAGRMRRDAGELLKDVVTIHPLRALGDGWRLLTSSWLLDGGDLALSTHMESSRRSYAAALKEPDHSLAA